MLFLHSLFRKHKFQSLVPCWHVYYIPQLIEPLGDCNCNAKQRQKVTAANPREIVHVSAHIAD